MLCCITTFSLTSTMSDEQCRTNRYIHLKKMLGPMPIDEVDDAGLNRKNGNSSQLTTVTTIWLPFIEA